ncbi:DNA-dependent RNA polymerase beta' subunit/160 kD subunit [Giardia duodenalis]|uniref:DNA-dependent RNA polymerase beta' subunit/160 kD subunit n=1 Tax=Giardia intestinalis TaxID=5741 RepID=V6TLX0_GIAIN|nr:DNA-dependent RNA polymerase beta' subunit/160 kD subunit [Giardia intestinalis]
MTTWCRWPLRPEPAKLLVHVGRHLHTYHKACPREIVIDDPGATQRLRDTKDRKGAIEQAIQQNTEMGEQYEAEQKRIIEIGARFALLVKKNAILGFNASLGAYLRTQIESLQNRIPSDLSEPHEHILRSLENFRRSLNSYNEERRTFQEAVSNGDAAVPTAGETCSRPGSRGGLAQGRGLLSGCGASERVRPAFWRCLV